MASEAEAELNQLGQAEPDPRVGELIQKARSLRKSADGMLADVVQSLKEATDAALRSRSR